MINRSSGGGLGYWGKEYGGTTGAAWWMESATIDCMLEVPINDAIIATHSFAHRVWLSVRCFGICGLVVVVVVEGGFIRFPTLPILILGDSVLHIAYCFGHPSDMLLHLPGLSARQFVMLSIVFNSVLVQSSCHDNSWIFESTWTHFFDKDPHHRTISLDATYIVPLKNHRAISWVSHLYNQVYFSGNGILAAAFFDAIVMCTVSYAVIDFNQSIPKKFCLCNTLFPNKDIPDGATNWPTYKEWENTKDQAEIPGPSFDSTPSP